MAYGYKSKYTRTYARKGRGARVAKMARGRITAVQALAKSVRTLQRKVKTQHQYLNYAQGVSTGVSENWYALNLSQYASYSPIFGTDTNDDDDNKIVHVAFGLDGYLDLANAVNNEENTITFTIFLVSLKDAIGNAFNPATGALTLNNGLHYQFQNGLVMLNKKVFNIHAIRRRVLTNHGTDLGSPSAQTQHGSNYRFYLKHRVNKVIQNPYGDWKAMSSAQDPSKQMYLLIFNDNSLVDLESPTFTCNVVHTMKTIV